MHKKLKEIVDIVLGYTFRKSIPDNMDGDIFVLQARDIILNKDIDNNDISSLLRIDSNSIRNPYFLKSGDILLISKSSSSGSSNFRSTIFISNANNVIASSSVIVLRIKDPLIISKYLSLYLNSLEGQKNISLITTGSSYLKTILIKDLYDIKIPIPSIHTQKSIIALHENIKEQEQILKRKQELQKNIINASFTRLINK